MKCKNSVDSLFKSYIYKGIKEFSYSPQKFCKSIQEKINFFETDFRNNIFRQLMSLVFVAPALAFLILGAVLSVAAALIHSISGFLASGLDLCMPIDHAFPLN